MHTRPTPWKLRFTLCLGILLLLAAAGPVAAAPVPALLSQVRDEEAIADHIAEIRSQAPDIEDTFDADSGTWDLGYSGDTTTYFRAGMLHIAVDVESTVAWSESSTVAGDFYLEVDTVHSEGPLNNQFGVIFHLEDSDNFLYFALGSDGYYSLQKLVDNEWEMVIEWTESEVVEIGEGSENTLGILAEGSTVTLLINDYIVDQVEDIEPQESKLALAAGTYDEAGSVVAFDNFAVWLLDGESQGPRAGRPIRVPESPSVTPTPEAETEEPATPEPSPTAGPQEEIPSDLIAAIRAQPPVYSEPFDEESATWEPNQFDGASYGVNSGELQVEISIPGALGWTLLDLRLDNFYLEVDAAYLDGPTIEEHGVLFRYVDPQNFYFFAVSESGEYSLWLLKQNEWQALQDWTDLPSAPEEPGSPIRLGLLAEGEQITLLVDGEIALEISDDSFPTGVIGLAVGTFDEAGARVAFDNLDIWEVDAGGEQTTVPEEIELPTAEPGEEQPADGPAGARLAEILATEPAVSTDFRRDEGEWDTSPSDNSQVFYQRRALHIEVSASDWIGWSEYQTEDEVPVTYTDLYAEVDISFVQRPEGAAAGMVFRLQDSDNFYYYALDAAGFYTLQKKVGGVWVDLIPWTESDLIDSEDEAINRVGILAEGDTLAITLNGEVVGEVEDADLDAGAVAMMAASGASGGVEASFDNFTLWDLSQ